MKPILRPLVFILLLLSGLSFSVDVSDCVNITSAGSYVLTADLVGAPNDATDVYFSTHAWGLNWSCIKIGSDDVILDCDGYSITNDGSVNSTGIAINSSVVAYTNVTIRNCPSISGYTIGVTVYNTNDSRVENTTSSDNIDVGGLQASGAGLVAYYSTRIEFVDVVTYNNTEEGIFADSSTSITVNGSTVHDNGGEGIYYTQVNNGTLSWNEVYDNTGYGIEVATGSYNFIANNLLYGNSRGVYLTNADRNTLHNNTAHDNVYGFNNFISDHTVCTENTAYDNTQHGFLFQLADNVTIYNNSAYGNTFDGFQVALTTNSNVELNRALDNGDGFDLSVSQDNNLTDNIAYFNSQNAFRFSSSDNLLVVNSIAQGSNAGAYIRTSNITVSTFHLYNNTDDLRVLTDGSVGSIVNATDMTFDNPAGDFQNYTNISMDDATAAGEDYTIAWTTNSSALPPLNRSFADKFVEMDVLTGPVSIDSIIWNWFDSELGPSDDESTFSLYKYNTTDGWTLLNDTPDTTGNTLSMFNMAPGSDYGILVPNNCPIITSSGTYLQDGNYVGAPNSAIPAPGSVCVKINVSDVVFDCNGYNITNDGTPTAYGVLVYGPLTNVTVQNCPMVSGYMVGMLLYQTNSSSVTDSVAYNNSNFGFMASDGADNSFTSNLAYESGVAGFYSLSSSNNTFQSNTAANNSGAYGFDIDTSPGCTLDDNTAYGNTVGVSVFFGSDPAAFTGGQIYNNNQGLFVQSSDLTTGADVHLYNNTEDLRADNGFTIGLARFIFDNPAGDYTDYTNLSITDTGGAGETYVVNWIANQTTPPSNTVFFANKIVNISPLAGGPSIDYVAWHWLDSEVGASVEDNIQLRRYSAGVWTVANTTPDTTANTLSLSNLAAFSDFALLEYIPAAGGGDGGGTGTSEGLAISVDPAGEGYVVTVEDDNADPVEDAFVETWDSLGGTYVGYTNESGQAYFTPCGVDLTVTAVKSGYQQETWTGYVECVPFGECQIDDDCPEAFQCIENVCVPVDCPNGEVIDHVCVPYECMVDNDCPEGQICVGHECILGCDSDDDCLDSQYCSIPQGQISGTCDEVECECGLVASHACQEYECCADEDCAAGEICEEHLCIPASITCPSTGLIGDDKDCNAQSGQEPCAFCDYSITGPDGRTYFGQTDGNGDLQLPLRLQGTYNVTLLRAGQAIKTVQVEALPRPVIEEEERPTSLMGDLVGAFFLVILLVLLVLALIYLRRRRGEKMARPKY